MSIVSLIVLIIGLVFLVAGAILLIIGKLTWKCTAKTTGMIVDMCYNAFDYNRGGSGKKAVLVSTGNSGPNTRCPVFEYSVGGITYRHASNVSWNIGHIKRNMNKPREVFYNPENPNIATLSGLNVLKLLGTILCGVAALTLIVGLILLIVL